MLNNAEICFMISNLASADFCRTNAFQCELFNLYTKLYGGDTVLYFWNVDSKTDSCSSISSKSHPIYALPSRYHHSLENLFQLLWHSPFGGCAGNLFTFSV